MAQRYFAIVVFEGDGSPKGNKEFEAAVIKTMKESLPHPVVASIYLAEEAHSASELLAEKFKSLDRERKG